jgi:hypothetical protein
MQEDFSQHPGADAELSVGHQAENGGLIGGEQTTDSAETPAQPTGQYKDDAATTPVLGEEHLSPVVEGPQPIDREVVVDGPIAGPGPIAEQSAEPAVAVEPLVEEPAAAVDAVDLGNGPKTQEMTLPSVETNGVATEAEAAPQPQYTETENGAGTVTPSVIGELPVDHTGDDQPTSE